MSKSALDGVRVVELAGSDAAALAARLLGDLGADVVRVEEITSDTEPEDRVAVGMREYLHWNKRSVSTAGQALDELLARADVVVLGVSPSELRRRQLGPAALRNLSPRGVHTYVTDFGLDGPFADYRATDLIHQAMSGLMSISGAAGQAPLKHGLRTALYGAGLNAAYATVMGLLSADRTGHGVLVDLAIRDCLTSELVMNNAFHAFAGIVQGRAPAVADPLDGHPVEGAHGYMSLQTSARQPIGRLGEFFADPRFDADEFATPELRVANAPALTTLIREHLDVEVARDLFVRSSEAGLVIGFVQGAGDMLACPHLADREVFVDLPDVDGSGGWRLPAALAFLSETPTRVGRTAPRPGQHSDEVLREWREGPRDLPTAPDAPAAGCHAGPLVGPLPGPLAGLRVLDLSVIFAAPYMGGLLADLGAEVIKVEAPHRLDQTRTDWGGYFDNDPGADPWNRSGTFQVVNRGKRSLGLDLSSREGRDVLRRLVAGADVLLDNFTPRVMPGWGLGFADLREINPGLIMLSNTGYGSTGPWAPYRAQGTTLEATMGLMAVTGYVDGPPARAGQSVPDFYACWAGLLAIGAALRHRSRTGRGQHIDLGMYQLGASMIPEALIHRQVHGSDLPRDGARDIDALYSAVVPARGEDRWLAISIEDTEQLRTLSHVAHHTGTSTSLDAAVRRWARDLDPHEAAEALQSRGVPAGPVNDAGDLARDPQLTARGFYENVPIPSLLCDRALIGRPYRWESAGSEVKIRAAAPDFGAHNHAVLHGVLGLDEETITRLHADKVVSDDPVDPPSARAMDVDLLQAKGTISRIETTVLTS